MKHRTTVTSAEDVSKAALATDQTLVITHVVSFTEFLSNFSLAILTRRYREKPMYSYVRQEKHPVSR
jgi:hypothetical protein